MSTPKQIAANRRNAQKSTGPRTPEGKAASRLNALKHGFFANSPVIIGEDQSLYDALANSYFDQFQPASPDEVTLLSTIIRNAWLLERFSRIETETWDRHLEDELRTGAETYALARVSYVRSSTLEALQRRVDCADRAFRRNLELLVKLQARRAQSLPAENGFVPPKPVARPATPAPKLHQKPLPPSENPLFTSPPLPSAA